MARAPSEWAAAVGLSVAAAFGWSTYYLFVLSVRPGTSVSSILFYPFAGGGLAFLLAALLRREARPLAGEFRHGGGYLRTSLLLGMQFAILASTYLTGPVDASLLSLLGDVVATPLLVAAWVVARRRQIASPGFVLGLVLSLAGGSLAIVGGRSLEAIPPLGWAAVPAVPVGVAFYFVLCARAQERLGPYVVVGHATLGAAVLTLLLSPLLPGGVPGLVEVDPFSLTLLIVNGLVSFFLAPLCYFRAIARVGLVLPPTLMTAIPVFTLLLATLLGYVPAPIALLGVPVAVVGGLLALRSEAGTAPAGLTASR